MREDIAACLRAERGLVIAPAGCGKTQLLRDCIESHAGAKPVLVLTHTNAGVAALKGRLSGVDSKTYSLSTIDGWAIKLVSLFPHRSGLPRAQLERERPDYLAIRAAAVELLKDRELQRILSANYSNLLVDEYQDCSVRQHSLISLASEAIDTCVFGDYMQAIFDFGRDGIASWSEDVLGRFEPVHELSTPWRWINAGKRELGKWLLEVRSSLANGEKVDLRNRPEDVEWVQLPADRNQAAQTMLRACRVSLPSNGRLLVMAESTSPQIQQKVASLTPGAATVEAVDLRDLTQFAANFDLDSDDAVEKLVEFASKMATGVNTAPVLKRIDTITRGRHKNPPNPFEGAILEFTSSRTFRHASDVLASIDRLPDTRVFRPMLMKGAIKSLLSADECGFSEACYKVREQQRFQSRTLARRSVGSTLLLKGLESEVAVVLNGDDLNARHLYVALTRGSHRLVICSRTPLVG